MKLRLLLVDDEPLARERVRRMLAEDPLVEIVGEASDGEMAVEAVRGTKPDVVLLDIQMPGMDGFGVLRELAGEPLPAVIFLTGFDRYAVQAFDARAIDYLLKPTPKSRLAEALNRVREKLAASRGDLTKPLLDMLAEHGLGDRRASRLAVRTNEGVIFVPTEDIDWVEAAGNYVILHVGKTTHILRETMSAMESQLPGTGFLRVSRSAIMNLKRTRELQLTATGDHVAVLTDGRKLPVTRSVREVEQRLRYA